MRIALIALLGVVVVAAVATQLILPGVAERQTENRLTANGGFADVSVSAFPALRLLFNDGSRLEVEGTGLHIEIDGRTEVFDRLDGFETVDVTIDEFTTGPFAIESFTLTRESPAPYRLRSRGSASPAQVVDYGLDRLGLPGGALLGGLAASAVGNRALPFSLDMELESSDGEISVVSGGGSVAGIPAGPLAQVITAAIVQRL